MKSNLKKFNIFCKYLTEAKKKEEEETEKTKDKQLLYHKVQIKATSSDVQDISYVEIKSLTDPSLSGYVEYENYEDAKMAFDSLHNISKIIDYMWRHLRNSPMAMDFDKIIGDEIRQDKVDDSDKIRIEIPTGRR